MLNIKLYKESLVVENLIVSDSGLINRIWEVVSFNEEYSPEHPSPKWLCFLEINTKDGKKYTLIINELQDSRHLGDRGTLVRIWTHIDAGNIIGGFKCDELGTILESIAKEKGLYNAKELAMNL